MLITYEFNFEGGNQRSFPVDTDRTKMSSDSKESVAPEKWTALEHCQCSNCPLKKDKVKYCPAALDLQDVIVAFKKSQRFRKWTLKSLLPTVLTPSERGWKRAYGP